MKKGPLLVIFISISILLNSCGLGVGRRMDEEGDIEFVIHKDPARLESVKREDIEELPLYTILDQIKLVGGGIHGYVLIKSFSKSTPKDVCESVLIRIAEIEGFMEASLYCTREAYQANISTAYAEAHPDVLKEGYLGILKEGRFSELK